MRRAERSGEARTRRELGAEGEARSPMSDLRASLQGGTRQKNEGIGQGESTKRKERVRSAASRRGLQRTPGSMRMVEECVRKKGARHLQSRLETKM